MFDAGARRWPWVRGVRRSALERRGSRGRPGPRRPSSSSTGGRARAAWPAPTLGRSRADLKTLNNRPVTARRPASTPGDVVGSNGQLLGVVGLADRHRPRLSSTAPGRARDRAGRGRRPASAAMTVNAPPCLGRPVVGWPTPWTPAPAVVLITEVHGLPAFDRSRQWRRRTGAARTVLEMPSTTASHVLGRAACPDEAGVVDQDVETTEALQPDPRAARPSSRHRPDVGHAAAVGVDFGCETAEDASVPSVPGSTS